MVDSEVEKAVNIILRHARPQSDQEGGQVAVLEVNEILSANAAPAKIRVGCGSVRTGAFRVASPCNVTSPEVSRTRADRSLIVGDMVIRGSW